MNKKVLNIIIGIVFAFFVVFFAGSFACEQYMINKSDRDYENSLQQETDDLEKENQSGQTNNEAK
jgi:uncharacterized protein YxeA